MQRASAIVKRHCAPSVTTWLEDTGRALPCRPLSYEVYHAYVQNAWVELVALCHCGWEAGAVDGYRAAAGSAGALRAWHNRDGRCVGSAPRSRWHTGGRCV